MREAVESALNKTFQLYIKEQKLRCFVVTCIATI